MSKILITGANKGIGFALAKEADFRGCDVFATCRNPETAFELRELLKSSINNFKIIEMNVIDISSIESVEKQIKELDILINNAGVIEPDEKLEKLDAESITKVFNVNSIAPMMVIKHFFEKLRQSKSPKIINISSKSGIISRVRSFNNLYSYKASKAALNMMTRLLSFELKDSSITVAAINPGWVRTDMGGQDADLSKEESAKMIMDVIEKISIGDTGKFLNYNGEICQW